MKVHFPLHRSADGELTVTNASRVSQSCAKLVIFSLRTSLWENIRVEHSGADCISLKTLPDLENL